MNTWFQADQHFFHDNILDYCNRPFDNVEQMHEKIISEHNKLVKENDVVFYVGDIGYSNFTRMKEVFEQLKGKKILILGNHDKWSITRYYELGFSAVLDDAHIKIGKNMVFLNHIPRRTITEFTRLCKIYIKDMRAKNKTWSQTIKRLKRVWKEYKKPSKNWTICGHVHQAWKVHGKNINVGVDVWKFKPVSTNQIMEIINKNGKL